MLVNDDVLPYCLTYREYLLQSCCVEILLQSKYSIIRFHCSRTNPSAITRIYIQHIPCGERWINCDFLN